VSGNQFHAGDVSGLVNNDFSAHFAGNGRHLRKLWVVGLHERDQVAFGDGGGDHGSSTRTRLLAKGD
jgi:hypothetical protein